MAQSLGGKSVLTSNGVILSYYVLATVSALFNGIPILFALVGVLLSRRVARQENAYLVVDHCTWLFRSIWVSGLIGILVVVGGILLLSASGVDISDNLPDFASFEDLWMQPETRLVAQYILGMVGGMLLVLVWFIYRVVRGVYKLAYSKAPLG